jgi:ATP-binding cassette subfamily B multidrug efflux pump
MIRLLVRYLKPYTWLVVGVVALQLVQSAASLFLPTLNAQIIDQGVATGDTALIWRLGLVMLGV